MISALQRTRLRESNNGKTRTWRLLAWSYPWRPSVWNQDVGLRGWALGLLNIDCKGDFLRSSFTCRYISQDWTDAPSWCVISNVVDVSDIQTCFLFTPRGHRLHLNMKFFQSLYWFVHKNPSNVHLNRHARCCKPSGVVKWALLSVARVKDDTQVYRLQTIYSVHRSLSLRLIWPLCLTSWCRRLTPYRLKTILKTEYKYSCWDEAFKIQTLFTDICQAMWRGQLLENTQRVKPVHPTRLHHNLEEHRCFFLLPELSQVIADKCEVREFSFAPWLRIGSPPLYSLSP